MKKVVSLCLCAFLLLSSFPSFAGISDPDDIEGVWGAATPAESILVKVDDRAALTVKGADKLCDSFSAYMAVYDEDGKIVSVDSETAVAASSNKITFDVPENASKIKTFVVSRDGVPVSESQKWDNPYTEEHEILMFGDGYAGAYNMGDVMVKLAENDGIKLDITPISYDNISKLVTATDYPVPHHQVFNIHETVSFSGTTPQSITTNGSDTFLNLRLAFEESSSHNYDRFVIFTSRDQSLTNSTSKTKNINASEYVSTELNKIYPGIKTIIAAPSGYKDGYDADRAPVSAPHVDFETHNTRIKNHAKNEVLPKIKTSKSAVYLCDAFEYFNDWYSDTNISLYDPYMIYPSMAGAYYIACVMYSSMFNRATEGIPFYGNIEDEATVLTLQRAADAYVRFSGITLQDHTSDKYVPVMTLEEADPRNQPVRAGYENEVYPENYDALISSAVAYYQRGSFVQYDNQSMDKSGGYSFYRRETSVCTPEDATPQNILYSDCSAFITACFKDALNYDFNGKVRCRPIFDDSTVKNTRVFYWNPNDTSDTRTRQQVSDDFYSTLQPGDVIDWVYTKEYTEAHPDSLGGHIMLYIGNGKMMHLTGKYSSSPNSSEDYMYDNGTDSYEMLHGILYEDVDEVAKLGHYLCPFTESKSSFECAIFRPLSLSLTPTTQASNRLKGLTNTVAYKRTTAPTGVTVAPGEDVTFTIIIKNLAGEGRTYRIADSVSSNVTLKDAEGFTVSGSSLSRNVFVPAYGCESVSYTVTVNSNVAVGSTITCHNTRIEGVLHNDAPISVGKTLTSDQKTSLASGAEAAGAAASSDIEFIRSLYSTALGKTLAFDNNLSYLKRVFVTSSSYTTPRTQSYSRDYLAPKLLGGKKFRNDSNYSTRIKRITAENLVTGDILIYTDNPDGSDAVSWLYLGEGKLATVKDGAYTVYSPADSQMLLESLMSKASYCVIRPSFKF